MFLKRNFKLFLRIAILLYSFSSCSSSKNIQTTPFEYLQYEQTGKQQINMRIYPGSSRSNIKIMLSSMNFQTYTKSFELTVSGTTADAFDDFYNTLNGSIPADQMDTAYFASKDLRMLKLIQGGKSIDVTNPMLRQRFKVFEEVVREELTP